MAAGAMSIADSYSDTYGNLHTDTKRDPNVYPDSDSDCHIHADSNCDGDVHTDPDANAYV